MYNKNKIIFCAAILLLLFLPMLTFLRVKEKTRLYGVEKDVTIPPITPAAFFAGSYQKTFEEFYAKTFFLRKGYLKIKNQLYDFANLGKFHSGYSGSITDGKNNVLFESGYFYCYYANMPVREANYKQILQDISIITPKLKKQNFDFIFILAPNKMDLYPEDRPFLHHILYKVKKPFSQPEISRLFEKYNIPHFAAAPFLVQKKNKYQERFFPIAGTHWNALATGLTLDAVLDKLNHEKPDAEKWQVNPLKGVVATSKKKARYADHDLGHLLNLFYSESMRKNICYLPEFANPEFKGNGGHALIAGDSYTCQVQQYLIDSGMFTETCKSENRILSAGEFWDAMNADKGIFFLVFNTCRLLTPDSISNYTSAIRSYLEKDENADAYFARTLKPEKKIFISSERYNYKTTGFHELNKQDSVRWTRDRKCSISCKLPWQGDGKYYIRLNAIHKKTVKYTDIFLSGKKVAVWQTKDNPDGFVFEINIPADDDMIRLDFEIHEPRNSFGLGFNSLEFLTKQEYDSLKTDQ